MDNPYPGYYVECEAQVGVATERVPGKARIATFDEISAGIGDASIVTPAKLRQVITFGAEDIVAGETSLATGSLYLVYE